MKIGTLIRGAVAAVALALCGGAVSASTVTMYLNGSGGLASSHSFSYGALTLTTTGHVLNYGNANPDGSIGAQVKIGQYSGGLGVTSSKYDQHFVDSNGTDEVVKFLFNMAVKIEIIWFTYVDRYDDFAFSVLNGTNVSFFAPNIDIVGKGGGSYTFSGNYVSNMFGIGAAGAGDAFKIKAIQVSYNDVASIPLPAAGWLLLAALGGLAAARRTRRA